MLIGAGLSTRTAERIATVAPIRTTPTPTRATPSRKCVSVPISDN